MKRMARFFEDLVKRAAADGKSVEGIFGNSHSREQSKLIEKLLQAKKIEIIKSVLLNLQERRRQSPRERILLPGLPLKSSSLNR